MEAVIELNENMTFGNYLGYWYETYSKRTVKRSTAISYRGYINGHISPVIGLYKLSELNTDILQRFFNAQCDNGNINDGGGLSPKTLHNIKRMLHKAVEKAVDLGLMKKNIIKCIELPKIEEAEMRVLTKMEQDKLMQELEGSRESLAFGVNLSIKLGLRLGEVLGLRWCDIDFRNKVVHIRRTVNRLSTLEGDKKTELVVGTPKTKRSIRDIPINDEYSAVLMSYYAKQSRINRKAPADDDYILQSTLGGAAEPKTMQKTFKRILKAAGIKDANFHSLRHTFATRAIEKGVDVKTLSVILGHSSVAITLNRYAHVLEEQKRLTMDVLLSD